jgi:hypothetical protein
MKGTFSPADCQFAQGNIFSRGRLPAGLNRSTPMGGFQPHVHRLDQNIAEEVTGI